MSTSALKAAVVQAVRSAAAQPTNDLKQADVPAVAAAVAAEMAADPRLAHATNAEPWYQSRVTLGAILAALAGVLAVFGWAFPAEVQGKVIDLIIALGPVIGGGLALWGRWVSTKPIGA